VQKNAGAVLRDGTMLGGGSYFYYFGTYTSANGKWRGEATNQDHTEEPGLASLPFARIVVTAGFTGTYTDESAETEATGLFGKRSLRFRSMFRLLKGLVNGRRMNSQTLRARADQVIE
jgi:hypothetical protein